MNADVIIVGSGVLGVSLAYHLGSTGKKVIVLERELLSGMHASGKNAGMFRQLYRHPQLSEWAMRSRLTWPEDIKKQAFRETGSTIVGRTCPNHHVDLFEEGEMVLLLQGSKLHEKVPFIFTATDGLLDSPLYVQLLQKLARQHDVTFLHQREICDLRQCGGTWNVLTKGAEEFTAPCVVNAAGAWINRFLSRSEHSPVVCARPFARHLFLVEGWPEGYMPYNTKGYYWDESNNWYAREWDPITRLVSICDKASAEPERFQPRAGLDAELAERLLATVPEVAPRLSIRRHWHCFRTYTEDQLPIFGPDPDFPGLFWLAAFGGFGMSTSFAAAEDAKNLILSSKIEYNRNILSDFSPCRVRELEKSVGTELLWEYSLRKEEKLSADKHQSHKSTLRIAEGPPKVD